MKTIPNQIITNISGKPMRVPETDAQEDIIWKAPGEPQMRDAIAADLIKVILFSIPRGIQKDADAMRAPALFNRIESAEDSVITLKEKLYDWLHKLLERPTTKGEDAHKYAIELWGVNAVWIVNQLKDKDEQKSKTELFPDDEE